MTTHGGIKITTTWRLLPSMIVRLADFLPPVIKLAVGNSQITTVNIRVKHRPLFRLYRWRKCS